MVYGTYNKTATPKTSVESRAHACMRARKPERVALWKHESVSGGSVEGWKHGAETSPQPPRKRPARAARTRKREHIHKLYWIAE